jgi:hypothetical protein
LAAVGWVTVLLLLFLFIVGLLGMTVSLWTWPVLLDLSMLGLLVLIQFSASAANKSEIFKWMCDLIELFAS